MSKRWAAPHASERLPRSRGLLTMALQFHCVDKKLEIWSANSDRYSFVISYESPAGPGFHGRAGYMASGVRFLQAVAQSGSQVRHLKLVPTHSPTRRSSRCS
jgi:hypothetical protein